MRRAARAGLRLTGAVAICLALAALAPAAATVILVNSTADVEADDGACTLREAAVAVNTDTASGALAGECDAGTASDTVIFVLPSDSTVTLVLTPVVFTEPVAILGPGADALRIAAVVERVLILDGSASSAYDFSVSGLRIAFGQATTAYLGQHTGSGGGLLAHNVGGLTISGVRFEENYAHQSGAGLYFDQWPGGTLVVEDSLFDSNDIDSGIAAGGAAIAGSFGGSVTVRRCLFVNNAAANPGTGVSDEGQGGAIWVPPFTTGTLAIEASTFSANRALGHGGAIAFGSPASPGFEPTVVTTITDSTFTANEADTNGNATAACGGALSTDWSDATVTLANTIVAGNSDGTPLDSAPDLVGNAGILVSGGYNLIGIRRGAGAVFAAGLPNASDDWVGTAATPLDPGLGALVDNGGATASHLPVDSPASPAIDHGSCATAAVDQRGWSDGLGSRIVDDGAVADSDDGCDIGAIEVGLTAPPDLFADDFETGDARAWAVVGWAL